MNENSFIPFSELREFPNGNKKKPALTKKVLKNKQVQNSGRRAISNQTNGHKSHDIQCSPVEKNGTVVAIDIKCGCGGETRIYLEYGD